MKEVGWNGSEPSRAWILLNLSLIQIKNSLIQVWQVKIKYSLSLIRIKNSLDRFNLNLIRIYSQDSWLEFTI